ncbi:MAG: putative DNA modification/repair radical SAM protein, partial [Eubacterium sp.]|nr:putative DNA modification/repair radical SAM protein [Eubacterium sp.]
HLGNSCAAGICHSFSSDGRCISLLKILQSNACIYNCKYCSSRADNDCRRATFTPDEICTLVIEFYRRNYIEGLFLSSAVCRNPTYTLELMYQTLYLLRTKYRFNGYIHVKAIPYAPPELIEKLGYLTDRISINLELPTAEGLQMLAPQKTRSSILQPMRQIQQRIVDHRLAIGKSASMERSSGNRYLHDTIFQHRSDMYLGDSNIDPGNPTILQDNIGKSDNPIAKTHNGKVPAAFRQASDQPFAPAGQSTQMIIGATGETDYQILATTQALYQQFDLKRVFFSAYVPLNEDSELPSLDTAPPLLREHRLYQADWLLRYYGFHAEELLTPTNPFFNLQIDPKCNWAVQHLEQFPVEIATADYSTLMRVPGIGNKSAIRIIQSRKAGSLSFESIKKMGVVLKRAQYFITCNGKLYHPFRLEETFITRQLTDTTARTDWEIAHPQSYQQLSLFDMTGFQAGTQA